MKDTISHLNFPGYSSYNSEAGLPYAVTSGKHFLKEYVKTIKVTDSLALTASPGSDHRS
ncbi:MAG: hypothetical protein JXN62_11210 [Bacteroidales bacterium]|nr:hypothetical protein [Bacteroidales bacterium]